MHSRRKDIEKAFDKVDWDYLDLILVAKSFGATWRKWKNGCISLPNHLIIINGRLEGGFLPSVASDKVMSSPPFFLSLLRIVSVE